MRAHTPHPGRKPQFRWDQELPLVLRRWPEHAAGLDSRRIISTAVVNFTRRAKLPYIISPSPVSNVELEKLSKWAVKAKELSLDGGEPNSELVSFCKMLSQKQNAAPAYLQPDPQIRMFHSIDDCLAVIELAVNWAVEELYGVEGLGPFTKPYRVLPEVSVRQPTASLRYTCSIP